MAVPLLLIAHIAAGATPAHAQTSDDCAAEPSVTGVRTDNDDRRLVHMEDYVHVSICGLDTLLESAPATSLPPCRCS